MSKRLDKAVAALDDAKKQSSNFELQTHLLDIARTQATIATAEANEELLRWCKLTATEQDDERKQAKHSRVR